MANPDHVKLVRRGSEAIRKWRNVNAEVLDLADATLARATLCESNLAGADLAHANLYGADLAGADLSSANLLGANLHEADLSDANLTGAHLAGAHLARATLSGAKLIEADLFNAGLTRANLRHADLTRAKLTHANMYQADLTHANLTRANLRHAELTRVNLSGANLYEADLSGVSLTEGNLAGAVLAGATLYYTNLAGTELAQADFQEARCMGTIFANVDLSKAQALDTIRHAGPSEISINTLYRSGGNIPSAFLRRAGVPQNLIESLPGLVESPTGFHSCFISFTEADNAFSKKIYDDLQKAGVRCWRYKEDAPWGVTMRKEIAKGIRLYDKLVVICSEHSLQIQPVLREIERALKKEDTLRSRGQAEEVLFPIRLDDYILSDQWDHEAKEKIHAKHIGDFRDWQQTDKYQQAFDRLLRDLNAGSVGK